MKEEGYSDSYSDSAGTVHTKSWDELMEEFLPDNELAQHHKELLNAVSIEH